jgi:hypothetical protein
MNTKSAYIDDAVVNLIPWPIRNLGEDVVMSSLHAQSAVDKLSCETFISIFEIRSGKCLWQKEIGVSPTSIYFRENVVGKNARRIRFR